MNDLYIDKHLLQPGMMHVGGKYDLECLAGSGVAARGVRTVQSWRSLLSDGSWLVSLESTGLAVRGGDVSEHVRDGG